MTQKLLNFATDRQITTFCRLQHSSVINYKMSEDAFNNTNISSIEERIKMLCEMDPTISQANSKVSNISLKDLKSMAHHLHLSQSLNKPQLIKSIRDRVANVEKLEDHEQNNSIRRDENTFARICNFLLTYPEALQRSTLLATSIQLQEKQVYAKQLIFVDCAERFNDWNYNSGGLFVNHEEFRSIDPEKKNLSGYLCFTSLIQFVL